MDNEYYYLDASRQPQGPLSFDELLGKVRAGELSPQVQVAKKGDAQWFPFALLATQQGIPGFEALPPAPGATAVSQMPPKPNNNLVWAILCTLLCCLPLGIVAIIKSSAVDGLYAQGKYDEANRAAAAAKNWSIWGAVIAIFPVLLYIVFVVVSLGLSEA